MNNDNKPELIDRQSYNKSFVLEPTYSMKNDLEGSLSGTVTLEMMNICKTKIIRPFNIMLTMVGWKSLHSQSQCRESLSLLLKIVDKIVLMIFMSLLLFSYVYECLACRFEKNTREKIVTVLPRITTTSSVHNFSTTKSIIGQMSIIRKNASESDGHYILCSHISSTYIIPNLIHLVAYILGMVHYRFNDNEDIYGLMEKTLQYSATLGTRRSNYSIVIRTLTFWMWMAIFWVFLSIISYILYDISFNTYASPFYIFKINFDDDTFTKNIKHLLFFLDFIGYIIASVVTVTITLNYTIYCELLKFYADAISKKIETRCIKINMIKNDIQNVDVYISLINGKIGKMMTLILILEINLLIVGIINLFVSSNGYRIEIAYRFFFVVHLIPLILTAMIQCIRVNLATNSFKTWARHMNVFGYRKENKSQLDSFLLFTMGYKSKVHLMAYPLESWQVVVFFITIGFLIITLIQTGVMDNTEIFKYL